jgi:hypothetical protein
MLVRLLHVARLRKFQLLAAHLNIENTIAVRNTQVGGRGEWRGPLHFIFGLQMAVRTLRNRTPFIAFRNTQVDGRRASPLPDSNLGSC